MPDRCVCCGEIIPEGRMICPICEHGPNNDPVGKRGPIGLCPVCGSTKTKWDPEKDICTCEKCGWHN